MSPVVIVALSVAGGIGAVTRLVFDGFLRSRVTTSYPLGTTVINVTGSLLLGLVTGLALAHAMPLEWRLILGTGFLGGYTTFSTASFETVRLAQQGRYAAALTNGLGMFLGALLAAGAGLWLGSLPW
ncbi:CrcB protein [Cryobacterium sp. CAN_C3]|uniref:fluoride efflux transporter CrcB n=1 Tax=unclassified Cryobacterium TaxID=2649013 RepID=UPI0018C8E8F6|nr:fluoride efflux transporter CrcB [Cryobacterium sp. CAN_C3]MEC5155615.1 CrcB protein [Cryobacterium sp. CAN_C3]